MFIKKKNERNQELIPEIFSHNGACFDNFFSFDLIKFNQTSISLECTQSLLKVNKISKNSEKRGLDKVTIKPFNF